jgi:hypothetical protein
MPPPPRTRVGELRPSQILFTFGVGAVVDLPRMSVMVMGLNEWPVADQQPIAEERLLAQVRARLGAQVEALRTPPVLEDTGIMGDLGERARVGVPVSPFPAWAVCPLCRTLAPLDSGLFKLKTDAITLDKNRWVHENCHVAKVPPPALPARFLVACENGHLDDFPWHWFVHQGAECEPRYKLFETGPTGEAADVLIKCEACDRQRVMAVAFGQEGREKMPLCSGRHPHLRESSEGCTHRMRAMLLGSSNSWFPVSLSAISVPSSDSSELARLVEDQWATLKDVESAVILDFLRKQGKLGALAQFSDDEILGAVLAQRVGADKDDGGADLKVGEWEVFSQPATAPTARDFQLRAVALPDGFEGLIKQVVLVERLREVRALVGFTRVESPYDEAEIDPERLGPLAKGSPKWAPAAEVRGEGIFIEFNEQRLQEWCDENADRADQFLRAHTAWRRRRSIENPQAGFPGLRYVLLHTLSHALMRQLVVECGYSAASVRERIYSLPPGVEDGPMAGILISTAAADSEGTLGGLVALGTPEELGRHLAAALRAAELCASDPLCAEHDPPTDGMTLHAAACHACMFAPETACERGNRYLDRSALVTTVAGGMTGFFDRASLVGP